MKIIMWIVAAIGGVLALTLALNLAGTIGSVATAPGRVIQQTLQTGNIISTYEGFHDRWKGYGARLQQIAETRGYLATEQDAGEKARLRVDLGAQRQSCRDIAARYNADATKTNRSIFMGREAPAELDILACDR